jgi:hypothetical protein
MIFPFLALWAGVFILWAQIYIWLFYRLYKRNLIVDFIGMGWGLGDNENK